MTRGLLISRDNAGGFFSNFTWVLAGLRIAEQEGLTPVVSLNRVEVPTSPVLHLLGRNVIEYDFGNYFKLHPRHSSPIEVLADQTVSRESHEELMSMPPAAIGDLYRRNLRISPYVQRVFTDVLSFLGLSSMTYCSVHVRYSDMRWMPQHPTPPQPIQVAKLALSEASELGVGIVFVSSESPKIVQNFVKLSYAKIRVLCLSDYRGEFEGELTRDSSLRVVIDALIHSQSISMVHGVSSVSFAARILREKASWRRLALDCGTNPNNLAWAVLTSVLRSTPLIDSQKKCKVTLELHR